MRTARRCCLEALSKINHHKKWDRRRHIPTKGHQAKHPRPAPDQSVKKSLEKLKGDPILEVGHWIPKALEWIRQGLTDITRWPYRRQFLLQD